ncbi:MAG: hypothetical protein HW416_3135, partial [Chloroflexi bacterium]|nr:hypothetical protein [Chloroflexota bacterium]
EFEQPRATTADFEDARAQAAHALAAPLTLTFQDRRWSVENSQIASMMSFERRDGRPAVLSLNPGILGGTFAQLAAEINQPVTNARFNWVGNGVRPIRESQEGRELDLAELRKLVVQRLITDNHVIALPVTVTRPAVASEDAPQLGIKELVREGRTTVAGVPEKQYNIALAASRLHGVVVPPGGTFSFNSEVGPTTLDAGFKTGWGIEQSGSGARTVPAVAGGICQVATTLFHPVFNAGYAIEERHWHLYWLPSYGQPPLGMKGLDATVDEDSGLDFQFINTTPDNLLIQSRVEGGALIFGLYGTKPTWKVDIEGPIITDVIPANRAVVSQAEPSMPVGRSLQVESAQDGFVSIIVRTVTQGEEVRTLRMRSNYIASRNVVLYGTGGRTGVPQPPRQES